MKNRSVYFSVIMIFVLGAGQYAYSGDSIDLGGSWKFRVDSGDEGIEGQWYSEDFGKTIELPGSMAQRGYGNDITVETPLDPVR